MPEWINIIALLIGGLGGMAGGAALWNARTTAKKGALDELRDIIESLREENRRLSDRIIALEATAALSRTEVSDLRDVIVTLREENERLERKIGELESENSKLRERVRGLESAG